MFFSCKKSSEKPSKFNVDTFVSISYLDETGKDLLDSSNSNSIKEKDIEIYYLVDGQKRHVYDPAMDLPKNFKIEKDPVNNKFYLDLFVSAIVDKDGISTTYIEIKNRSTDTITARIYNSSSLTKVTDGWYNGKIAEKTNGEIMFSVIK